LGDDKFRLGHIPGCLGVLHILLAHRSPYGAIEEGLEALVLPTRVSGVSLRRLKVRLGLGDLFGATAVVEPCDDVPLGRYMSLSLGDLFGAAAVAEPFHDLRLGRRLSLSLRHLRLQAPRVEPGQHLTPPHVVTLLDQHVGDPLAVVERQLYLP
jgi:hypothetical protein